MLRFCFESSVRKSDLLTESVNGASVKQDDMRAITYDAAAHGTISDLLLNLSLAREPVVVKGAYGSFVRAVPLNLTCEQMTWWKGQAFVQHNSRIFFHERHGSGQRWEEPRREKVSDAQCKRLRARESFLLASEEITGSVPADVVSALTVREVEDEPMSVNVWMGRDGIVSAGHYDHHHNAFLQLAHAKTWTLAPPTEALRLRLFPRAHPRDRQSQAGLLMPSKTEAEGSTCAADDVQHEKKRVQAAADRDEAPARHAPYPSADEWSPPAPSSHLTLRPGDLLYLPPLYAHRVAALTEPAEGSAATPARDTYNETAVSISINAFSHSHESVANKELLAIGLPPSMGSGTASVTRIRATGKDSSAREAREAAALPATLRTQLFVSYLRHVIAAAMSDQQHVVRREEEEVEQAAGATDDAAQLEETQVAMAASSFLLLHLSSRWSPLYASIGCATFEPSACPQARDPLPHHLQRDASSHAQKAASVLRERTWPLEQARGAAEASAVRGLLLIRYVELLVTHFLGAATGAAQQCRFLRCMATPEFFSSSAKS